MMYKKIILTLCLCIIFNICVFADEVIEQPTNEVVVEQPTNGVVTEQPADEVVVEVPEKPRIFSPTTTNFESSITVKFVPVAEDISIYYTTDGSTPTTLSKLYLDGIDLSETATVKAIAVKNNISSEPIQRKYTITRPRRSSNNDTSQAPINLNTNLPKPKASSSPLKQALVQMEEQKLKLSDKFSDTSGHWAKEYIDDLVNSEVINGYEDKTFRPNDLITRAEAIKIIVSAMKMQPTKKANLTFDDNSSIPTWATGFLEVAIEKGITKGYDDNTIRVLQSITREELSVLAMRAFDTSDQGRQGPQFADKNEISNWALPYINNAVALGIITGYEDNTFKPNELVTRAEAVSILSKCMHKLQVR